MRRQVSKVTSYSREERLHLFSASRDLYVLLRPWCISPTELHEAVATLHFPALGEVLTVLARKHAVYTGAKVKALSGLQERRPVDVVRPQRSFRRLRCPQCARAGFGAELTGLRPGRC